MGLQPIDEMLDLDPKEWLRGVKVEGARKHLESMNGWYEYRECDAHGDTPAPGYECWSLAVWRQQTGGRPWLVRTDPNGVRYTIVYHTLTKTWKLVEKTFSGRFCEYQV